MNQSEAKRLVCRLTSALLDRAADHQEQWFTDEEGDSYSDADVARIKKASDELSQELYDRGRYNTSCLKDYP
jgi:hypothetical protein